MATSQQCDIALVTGAGSGVGRATSKILAERGSLVVAADINQDAAAETVKALVGGNNLVVHLDVSNRDNVEMVINDVITQYGRPPNIAVNCAGLPLVQPLLDLTEETCSRLLNVNVKGTIWVTQAICIKLVAAKMTGSIVNVASLAKTGLPGLAVYSATKGAVESFSMAAAKEFGPAGIRVNVVSPGLVNTAMMAPFPDHLTREYCAANPLHRVAQPQEIAEVIAFLASDKSSYVNGATMDVHGGHV